MTNVRIPNIEHEFRVSDATAEVYLPNEMHKRLSELPGTSVWFEYERGIDGPQTATRLLVQSLQEKGWQIVNSPEHANLAVWIQGAGEPARFTFITVIPDSPDSYISHQCGPRELTGAVMTAVCKLFPSIAVPKSNIDSLLSQLDSRKVASSADLEERIVHMGEEATDGILASMTVLNRQLVNAALSRSEQFSPPILMSALERRVRLLGRMRSQKGVKAVLDVLGDTAGVSPGDPFDCKECRSLKATAKEALVSMGDVALPTLRKFRHDKDVPHHIRAAIEDVYSSLGHKRRWQFWR